MKTRLLISKSESGQAIVLLTFGIITLLAFFALAVDGGMYYSERRDAQGAADSAALTAALAICSGEDAADAAEYIALENGYDNDGLTNTVTVYEPPADGYYAGQENYVEVVITTNTPGTVTSLVGNSKLESTVHAVAYCGTESSGTSSYMSTVATNSGIILLNDDASSALQVTGNGDVIVNNGDLFVNSDHSQAVKISGNGDIEAGSVSIVGGYRETGNGEVSPTPITGVAQLSGPVFPNLVPPTKPEGSCTTVSVSGNRDVTIDPGLYCSISVSANGDLWMNSGVYWIESGSFKITGNGDVYADSGVLLYMGPSAGSVQITGNGDFAITPMATGAYTGLTVYQHPDNSNTIRISGNGDSTSMSGTFYLPSAQASITGNGDMEVSAQLVVNTLKSSGNGDVIIGFGEAVIYTEPSSDVTTISLAE